MKMPVRVSARDDWCDHAGHRLAQIVASPHLLHASLRRRPRNPEAASEPLARPDERRPQDRFARRARSGGDTRVRAAIHYDETEFGA